MTILSTYHIVADIQAIRTNMSCDRLKAQNLQSFHIKYLVRKTVLGSNSMTRHRAPIDMPLVFHHVHLERINETAAKSERIDYEKPKRMIYCNRVVADRE